MPLLRWFNRPSTYIFWVIYLIFAGQVVYSELESRAAGTVKHFPIVSPSIESQILFLLVIGIFINVLLRGFGLVLKFLFVAVNVPAKGDPPKSGG